MSSVAPRSGLRKLPRLRFAGRCARCGIGLSKGTEAWYDDENHKVVCLACGPLDAGASAAAEGKRRVERKVERTRAQDGDYAAAVAAELAERRNTATWAKGAEAEAQVAHFVADELGGEVLPLHDRRIPGERTNIDLIWIAPTGVWVVDAKAYSGKVEQRTTGPIWNLQSELFVKNRNRNSLTHGLAHQVEAVTVAVRLDPQLTDIRIFGALCFVGADWGFFASPFSVGRAWVTQPKALVRELKRPGPLARETMEHVAQRLALSLPSASATSQ